MQTKIGITVCLDLTNKSYHCFFTLSLVYSCANISYHRVSLKCVSSWCPAPDCFPKQPVLGLCGCIRSIRISACFPPRHTLSLPGPSSPCVPSTGPGKLWLVSLNWTVGSLSLWYWCSFKITRITRFGSIYFFSFICLKMTMRLNFHSYSCPHWHRQE